MCTLLPRRFGKHHITAGYSRSSSFCTTSHKRQVQKKPTRSMLFYQQLTAVYQDHEVSSANGSSCAAAFQAPRAKVALTPAEGIPSFFCWFHFTVAWAGFHGLLCWRCPTMLWQSFCFSVCRVCVFLWEPLWSAWLYVGRLFAWTDFLSVLKCVKVRLW